MQLKLRKKALKLSKILPEGGQVEPALGEPSPSGQRSGFFWLPGASWLTGPSGRRSGFFWLSRAFWLTGFFICLPEHFF